MRTMYKGDTGPRTEVDLVQLRLILKNGEKREYIIVHNFKFCAIHHGSVDEPMGSKISSKKVLRSGPDIQRFLEDAAEATAEFARTAGISIVIPDRNLAAEDPLNFGSRVFARFSSCCNVGQAKRRVVRPGGWKTAPFILGCEIGERLGSTTITYNLVVYLTSQMNLPLVEAVLITTASFSASSLAPLFGEFLADAHLGRFTAVAAGSVLHLGGLVLFNLLVMASNLRPSTCNRESNGDEPRDDQCHLATSLQMAILFLSLILQAVGSGGVRPCAAPCGADQFDESNAVHQSQIQILFNWYKACIASTTIVAVTVVVWIQTNVGWGWGSLVLSITMGLSLLALLFGSSFYHCGDANGSPLTSLLRVLVAAIRKRKLRLPDNPGELYQVKTQGINNDLLLHTENMRWLDKAAILEDWKDDIELRECNPWALCTVHQVEELKKILTMAPVWLCTSISAILYIPVFTVMTKQAMTMNRSVGDLEIPAASMGVFSILIFLLFVPLYDAYLVTVLRKLTRHPKGLTCLQRVGVGMFIGILAMAVSAISENRRRAVAISNIGNNQQLSGFWLLPQFVLAGLGESFTVPGLLQFFYDEAPSRLQGVHKSFVWAALGMGGLLSAMLVSILQGVTKSRTGEAIGWLHDDINRGRLDYFYCTLAILTILVFTIYVFIASAYAYSIKTDLEPGHTEI